MKVLILVLLFSVNLAFPTEWVPKNQHEIYEACKECSAKYPIPDEAMQKIKMWDIPDTEAVRKYILCAVTKNDMFSEHEGYHADRTARIFNLDLDEAEALQIAENCADKNKEKSSVDVFAYRDYMCLLNSKLGEGVRRYGGSSSEANNDLSSIK